MACPEGDEEFPLLASQVDRGDSTALTADDVGVGWFGQPYE
jgi:hypothetical protein